MWWIAAALGATPLDEALAVELAPTDEGWAVTVGDRTVYRTPARCRTGARCVTTASGLAAELPAWQRPRWAERNLAPYCSEGMVDACLAIAGMAGDDLAFRCVEDPAVCGDWVRGNPDADHAAALLERGCGAADGGACRARADGEAPQERLSWLGRACELDVACDEHAQLAEDLARAELQRNCLAGEGAACMDLAERLPDGDQVDGREASDWVVEACVHGSEEGCRGFELETGRLGLDHPDVHTILETLRERCDGGTAGACRVAASLLRRSKPRDQRYAEALVLYGEGCRSGDGDACLEGGAYRRIGKARKAGDPPMELWRTGCEQDHGGSCTRLGETLHARRKTRGEGREVLQHGCEAGSAAACGVLGTFERRSSPETARTLFERGCEGGDGLACRELGRMVQRATKGRLTPSHDAFPAYSLGCDARDAQACLRTAAAHRTRHTAWDDEQRYVLTERGCLAGGIDGVPACRAQAKLLKRGRGVERDRRQGRALARAYAKRRAPRLFRFTAGVGLPAVFSVGAEAKLPVRSALSFTVAGEIGGASLKESGPVGGFIGSVGVAAGSLVGRLYPGRNASGLYVGGGLAFGRLWGDLLDAPEQDSIPLNGPTVRLGLNAQRGLVGFGLEVGATLPLADGPLPLVPVVALRIGISPR